MRQLSLLVLVGMVFHTACSEGSRPEVGKQEGYSLKQITTSPDGDQKAVHNMYVSGKKSRVEMQAPMPGVQGSMVIISDQEAGMTWTLFTGQKTYFELPLDEYESESLINKFRDSQAVEQLGRETLLGYDCEKRKVSSEMDVMGRKITSTHTVWMSDQFDFPLKVVGENGSVTEVTEILEGKQASDLFVVPEDFTKVSNLMEAMGMPMK